MSWLTRYVFLTFDVRYDNERLRFLCDLLQLGWSVPAIWAGIWVVVTAIWIRVELRRERNYWRGVRLTQQLQGAAECNDLESIDTIE